MSIKDRLIQFVLRGKDELSPEAKKAAEALQKVSAEGKELTAALDNAKGAQGLALGLKNTSAAAERAQTTLDRTEKRITSLQDELEKNPASKGLTVSLRSAEREAAKAARELDRLTAQTKEMEAAAQAAGIDTRNLSEEEKRLAAEVDRAKTAVTGNTKQLRELERQQRAAGRAAAEHKTRVDSAKEAMNSAGKRVLGFAAAYVSLNAAMRLVQGGLNLVRDGIRSMLETGSDFEQMQLRITGLMGSVAEGEKATAWISDFAKQTGQLIPDVTEAFALLKAYGLDPMDGSLQAITDKSVQLGGGMERLQGITGALGQMWAKEKIQQEEVLQLTERGVVVWPLLEKAMGKTTAQLQDMAAKGLLGRDAVKLLIDEIGRTADGAAAAGLETLTGKMNLLRNSAAEFLDRIADSGAMDEVKERMTGLADQIDRMDQDGTLDNLAQALSNAFVQGIEKVEEFAKELGAVDFKQLSDDSAAWLNQFGTKIDETRTRVQLFVAPFRTLFNGLTAGISGIGAAFTGTMGLMLGAVEAVSAKIPDLLGGEKIHASVKSAREALNGMRDGFVAQIEQDGQDIRNAWDITADHQKKTSKAGADAAKDAEQEKLAAAEATAAKVEELNARFAKSAVDAAATGKAAIVDMANAMKLIDAAETVDQLDGLKDALHKAYRDGTISQEEYNTGLILTNDRIKKLGTSSTAANVGINELVKSLESFADVQNAIGTAQTDVDITKLSSAIRKMYGDGKLTADEYKQALAELEKQKAEVKKATDEHGKSERSLAGQIDYVTKALNEKKAAEQQAASEASAAAAERAQEMNAWGGYVDSVMTAAREPLAALSKQALAAFDSMNDISNADMTIDTSGVEATRESLKHLDEAMGETQRELANVMRGPWAKWASENISQSQQIRKEYLKQKLSLQELMERYESGATSLAGFRTQAMSLKGSLDLLDQSDLGQLDSAIASAEQRMKSLGDSTRSTVDSLRDELDKLRGNEEAIERRRMASRRRDLQAQLAEARAAGDGSAASNINEALVLLRSVESETARVREQEARQNRREPTQATAPGTTAPTPAPATIIRLETARGSAVDVSVPPGQEDQLLSILEQSGLRTI
ncbi:tape measure protein [Pseudomonas sp. gcc21]|uniref:tape measure protein n=1 Tax=Pseudomonas sp. gcc21 TaxID=2726989 RepID=UPI0014517D7A|nr:tape measure protein [Pseudomonas sp. gcc21]QJD58199.1 tape measure protein [Pseudomonas sp. gcc21]